MPSSKVFRRSSLQIAVALIASPLTVVGQEVVAPAVEVVGATPVRGLDIPREELPVVVQSLGARALDENRSQPLPDLLNSRLSGVSVNEVTGNAYQSDVNYRGYTASPLLGTPQGLSVYQDGVRINEPFGDVVSWDLIPRTAVASIDLIPGSNPLFGLNTLGGALSLTTKSGLAYSGTGLEVGAGSFGRREVELEAGRKYGEFGVYLAGSSAREDGWRDHSPSSVDQVFAKLSRQSGPLEWDLAYTGARSDLIGNGLLPSTMLEARRESIFTRPDNAVSRLSMLTFTTSYWLDDQSRLTGLVYVRDQRRSTLNGDANDDFEEDPALDGAEGANGGAGFNQATAANNRTETEQRSWGAAAQWVRTDDHNHLAVGATLDRSRSEFEQLSELGVFDPTRAVVAQSPQEEENELSGKSSTWSVFFTDTYKATDALALTGALRYNRTHVVTRDELNPTPPNLDGDHAYSKLNPALGVAYTLSPAVTLFANATQGSRAPSPIELGCADPANPCSLPNAMQADPFLNQVVTRTVEAGVRGKRDRLRWNATVFRADNHDDILFVGTSSSAGYFTNFGKTRREGVEVGANARLGPVSLRADYSYVKATYQASACLLAENNSTRGQSAECTAGGQDDEILVRAGNRIPGLPLHTLKLGADWQATPSWSLSADLVAFSSQYLRGNENNAHQAGDATDLNGDTRTFLGPGEAAGYSIVNLSTRYQVAKNWRLSARVNNVFDKRYATAGALAENPFNAAGVFQTNSDNWTRDSFYAPGAPRSFFFSVAVDLD